MFNPSDVLFIKSCAEIHADANFQPHISERELLLLVSDEKGNTRYTPRRAALAIQPSKIPTLAALYDIKIALKSAVGEEETPHWHIDNSAMIYVNLQGKKSLHARADIENGDFTKPLTHLNVSDFLNQPSLHCSHSAEGPLYRKL